MEYKIESTLHLNQAEKILQEHASHGWKLHTFTTSYEGKNYVMVFVREK